jgi:hypothetical protein
LAAHPREEVMALILADAVSAQSGDARSRLATGLKSR